MVDATHILPCRENRVHINFRDMEDQETVAAL